MELEYDSRKSAENALKRNLPFDRLADLDWAAASEFVDKRSDYGEIRIIAIAPMGESGRLHIVCYVARGARRRIISFRKANEREARFYGQATSDR